MGIQMGAVDKWVFLKNRPKFRRSNAGLQDVIFAFFAKYIVCKQPQMSTP